LIVVYVALAVLLNVVVLVPGGPSYESGLRFVGWVLFEAMLVWLLWHRSRLAWMLLIFAGLVDVGFILFDPGDLATILMTLVALGKIAVLVAPSVLTFVWARRRTPAASL
jgi:hypothetical protein